MLIFAWFLIECKKILGSGEPLEFKLNSTEGFDISQLAELLTVWLSEILPFCPVANPLVLVTIHAAVNDYLVIVSQAETLTGHRTTYDEKKI